MSYDSADVLTTDSGFEVHGVALTPYMLLDRVTAIYGPTGSGKSIYTLALMKMLLGAHDKGRDTGRATALALSGSAG